MTHTVVDTPVLKWRPEDFLVVESTALRLRHDGQGGYQYLRLRKRGHATFTAVAAVAAFAGLPSRQVCYAGLKDEDAVTDQYLSVPACQAGYPVDEFNRAHASDQAYLHLTTHGHGDEPLRVGRLDGNSFRIVIRNLAPVTVDALAGHRHNHLFLNYYDTQRFGVPGGPRLTHRIGAHLSAGNPAAALSLLIQSGAPESAPAQAWTGTPEEFFTSLDPRLRSFYLSAHVSHDWNQQLAALLDPADETDTEHRDGIAYRFSSRRETLATIAVAQPELDYTKYRSTGDGDVAATPSSRSTVIQAHVHAGPAEPDEAHPGHHRCEVAMFLPSGCYATTAVAQLLARLPRPIPGA
jgi:tRNA pseudouridine13 synthase